MVRAPTPLQRRHCIWRRLLLPWALAAAAVTSAALTGAPSLTAAHVHLPTVITSPAGRSWTVPGVCFLPGEIPARAHAVARAMHAYRFPEHATRAFQLLTSRWMSPRLRALDRWQKRTTRTEAALQRDGYACFVEHWEVLYVDAAYQFVLQLSGRQRWSDAQWAAVYRGGRHRPAPHPHPHRPHRHTAAAAAACGGGAAAAAASSGAAATPVANATGVVTADVERDADAAAAAAAVAAAVVAAIANDDGDRRAAPPRRHGPPDAPVLPDPVDRLGYRNGNDGSGGGGEAGSACGGGGGGAAAGSGGADGALPAPAVRRKGGVICAPCCIILNWDGTSKVFRLCVKRHGCTKWNC